MAGRGEGCTAVAGICLKIDAVVVLYGEELYYNIPPLCLTRLIFCSREVWKILSD